MRNEDKKRTPPLLRVVCSAGDRTILLVFQNSKLGELIHKYDNTLLLLISDTTLSLNSLNEVTSAKGTYAKNYYIQEYERASIG